MREPLETTVGGGKCTAITTNSVFSPNRRSPNKGSLGGSIKTYGCTYRLLPCCSRRGYMKHHHKINGSISAHVCNKVSLTVKNPVFFYTFPLIGGDFLPFSAEAGKVSDTELNRANTIGSQRSSATVQPVFVF